MASFLLLAFIIAFAIGVSIFRLKAKDTEEEKAKYRYKKRTFFLTRAEHEFYDALVLAAGSEYFIFAQVHLPTLLEHTIPGQNWRAALAHINRKSVDFVLCDKKYISPKLAIELDDKSHEHTDRQERDREVERILEEARIPLLRIKNKGRFIPNELATEIHQKLISDDGKENEQRY